jgi:hypothetical protein
MAWPVVVSTGRAVSLLANKFAVSHSNHPNGGLVSLEVIVILLELPCSLEPTLLLTLAVGFEISIKQLFQMYNLHQQSEL